MAVETVLMYNCDDEQWAKLRQIFLMLRVRIRPVEADQYGLTLEDLLGREELYYHTGSAYGVYALLSYDPNTGDGVVVLTTGAPRQVDDRGLYQLCARLSEQLYAAMEEHEA